MDEREMFEKWATSAIYKMRSSWFDLSPHSGKYEYPTEESWQSWLESAYRADRKAREECCEIVRSERIANECKLESDEAYNIALTHAEQAIRATIQEAK